LRDGPNGGYFDSEGGKNSQTTLEEETFVQNDEKVELIREDAT
jgi:hypothetical protein